ncbi:MAG: hypothetical protein K5685_14305 [Bacteroidales bacterium]|nr:hypothetical protein [Bacteroidales bacterium]
MKKIIPLILLSAGMFFYSCKDGEYSLEDLNTDNVVVSTGVNGPLMNTAISFKDLFTIAGVKEDKEITIQGLDGKPEKIKFNPSTLDELIEKYHFDKEPIKLIYEDGQGNDLEQTIEMSNVIEGLSLNKIFDDDNGAVDSLGVIKLRISYTNDWPFEGTFYLRAVKLIDNSTALPYELQPELIKYRWNDKNFVLKAKSSGTATISFENSDMALLKAADALSIDFTIDSKADKIQEIRATDSLKFDVKGTLNGKFIINNFD